MATKSKASAIANQCFLDGEQHLADALKIDSTKVPAPVVHSVYQAVFRVAKAVVLFEKTVAPQDQDKVFLEFINLLYRLKPGLEEYGKYARYVQNVETKAIYEGSEAIDPAEAYELRDRARSFMQMCGSWIGATFTLADDKPAEDEN